MSRRRWILLVCFIMLAIVAVLASSLRDVHFKPGKSIAPDAPAASPLTISVSQAITEIPLWKILVFWLAIVINIVLFFWLLPPEIRKRILRQLLTVAMGALILVIALRYRIIQLPFLQTQPAENTGQTVSATGPHSGIPQFHAPQMSAWTIYLVSLGVLFILLLLAWATMRWWLRFRTHRHSSLDDIAGIAHSSLDDLAAGRDWGDVIIQSYVRMSAVIGANRGLHRAQAMTPREFASRLERAGLPADAVRRLTNLFEVCALWRSQVNPIRSHRSSRLPQLDLAGVRGGRMIRFRLLLLAISLLFSAVLAYFLRGLIYDLILMPLAYLLWLAGLYYSAIPQVIIWIVLMVALVVLLAWNLVPTVWPSSRQPRQLRAAEGQVEALAAWIRKSRHGNYFKWQLANRLGRIARQVREMSGQRDALTGADGPVADYLDAGLNHSFVDYPVPGNRFRHRPSTPLDLDPGAAIAYLESQMEIRRDRHS